MRTIIIKGRTGRYNDVSPFLVERGKLELKVDLPDNSGEYYLVAELNGKTHKLFIPRDGAVSLDVEVGELRMEIKWYLRGTLLDTWRVEPLLIKEVDGNVAAFPEIEYLKEKLTGLETAMNDALDKLEKTVEDELHKRAVDFLSYAYAEYEGDLQLNNKGLTVEAFMSALGYDPKEFTEEEIAAIVRKKEEL